MARPKQLQHPKAVMFRAWRKQLKEAGFDSSQIARLMMLKARMLNAGD